MRSDLGKQIAMHPTRILSASVAFQEQPFLKPLVLSTGPIERITQATATVQVRVGDLEATGRGSIYLSDLWAWPDAQYSHDQRDQTLRAMSQWIAENLPHLSGNEPHHPLELGLRLHHSVNHTTNPSFTHVPVLARSMCLSPFDAAIHDATGIALRRSAFSLYNDQTPIPSADAYFPNGTSRAIQSTLRTKPSRELSAWLIVGKNDNLQTDVRPWIQDRGYLCFKLKLMGRDNDIDVQRTVEVFNLVRAQGVVDPQLSIDSNEANPDSASVLDYLDRLRAASPEALAALKYIEQPTGRDITQHRFDWQKVTAIKPVLLDEGLTAPELLPEAQRQGWSGFALKTCKGHSFLLMAAAWAHQQGMLVSLQDLTNPGYAMIHAALCAAYLPTINGVELNSPQFTPAANQPWQAKFPDLFSPRSGIHRIDAGTELGLGSLSTT
jgi:L-alanine-DL-glutamate epimerase-like enolase superfamily enzyme